MKESNFYSDDFEQLLREKTEQYKMYPSEKVWKGIHSSLHTKRKWFITGMSLLITGILGFAGRELLFPSKAELARKVIITTRGLTGGAAGNEENISALAVLSGQHSTRSGASAARQTFTTIDDHTYTEINVSLSRPVDGQPDISGMLSQVVSLPAEPPVIPLIAVASPVHVNTAGYMSTPGNTSAMANPGIPGSTAGNQTPNSYSSQSGSIPAVAANSNGTNSTNSTTGINGTNGISSNIGINSANSSNGINGATGINGTNNINSATGTNSTNSANGINSSMPNAASAAPHAARINASSRGALAVTRTGSTSVNGNETLLDSSGRTVSGNVRWTDAIADQQRINWLYDYAVYNMPTSPKRGRTFFQLYVTPTATWRSVSGGQQASKSYFMRGDATDYLDRSPALGFEVGGMLMYKVTRNLTLKAGLQFGFMRNVLKAYASSPLRPGSDLNSPYGYLMDSMSAISTFRNFDGRTQVRLTNDFYQLSAPVGFELRVLGNERLQLHIAATVQPGVLLNTNSYMLTGDYTNYVKGPGQFRRWNVNGAVETFLSYKLQNGLRLQAGPEFRYQLFSSYKPGYPIQEHLKGYGLKIGIVKAIP